MIDTDLIQYCMDDFKRRTDAVQAIACPDMKSATYSFSEIKDGVTTEKLRKDFGLIGKTPAIYRISVDAEHALAMKQAFENVYSVKDRGYNVPRLNQTTDVTPTIYIGSSNDLVARLRQHLHRVSSTYALNMGRWIEQLEVEDLENVTVTVEVQIFDSNVNNEIIQDIEDALWSKNRPLFGRRGSR